MTHDDIFDTVSRTLVEMFQLDPTSITMDTRLAEDLDLDSIDGVDLVAQLQEVTGRRLTEDDLRSIRTVADVVDVIEKMLSAKV